MRPLLAVAVALLLVPASAAADDASLKRTWDRYDKRGDLLGAGLSQKELRQPGRAPKLIRKAVRISRSARRALGRDRGSSPAGRAARKAGIVALRASEPVLRSALPIIEILSEGLTRAKAGDDAGAERALSEAFDRIRAFNKRAKRPARLVRRAERLFARIA